MCVGAVTLAATGAGPFLGSGLAAQEGAPSREAPAPGEPGVALTQEEAAARAVNASPELAAAEAEARAAQAGADGARAFLWPTVGLEGGLVRSDDPVAVFGGKLRHGDFGQADFAVDRLVDPAPLTDWSGGAGGRWDALDPTRWATASAARGDAGAAALQAARAREATAYRARVLWVAAAAAEARRDAAVAAEDAARATADLLRRRRGEGMLTDADVLRGEAALSGATVARLRAEQAVADARLRLGAHLGYAPGTEVRPAAPLEVPAPLDGPPSPGARGGGDADNPAPAVSTRADLQAAGRAVDAARSRERAAAAVRLPTVGAFAGVTRYAAGAFDGGRTHVTAGVEVHVPLFTGFAAGAGVRVARARREAAEARRDALVLEASAQVETARRAVSAARAAQRASADGAASAREALRLVRRRFQEGMATTADLLEAQAAASGAAAAEVDALAELYRARATLAFLSPDIRLPEED